MFQLSHLNREYLIVAMKCMHNALLGQYMRENVEGTEQLITQVERYLNRLFHTNSQQRIP